MIPLLIGVRKKDEIQKHTSATLPLFLLDFSMLLKQEWIKLIFGNYL